MFRIAQSKACLRALSATANNSSALLSSTQRNFSFYENYSVTCEDYEKTRRASGMTEFTQEIKNLYTKNYQPLNKYYQPKNSYSYEQFLADFHLLDGGCGTGLYTKANYDFGIGQITGLEFNPGMLNKCQTKMQVENQRKTDQAQALAQQLRFFEGNICEMPFKSNSFDTIMINLVLHHIDDEATRKQDLANVKKVFKRCNDVINKDGMLFITTCSPIQFEQGLWYYQFFPESTKAMIEKFRDEEWHIKHLLEAGFANVEIKKITETNMFFEDYYNFKGPFDAEWRNGDSFFALVPEEELQNGLKEIQKILDSETETKLFYEQCERQRLEFGHAIAVIAHN